MISFVDIVRWILLIILLGIAYRHSHWSIFGTLVIIIVFLEFHMYDQCSRKSKAENFILQMRAEYIKERLTKAAEKKQKE